MLPEPMTSATRQAKTAVSQQHEYIHRKADPHHSQVGDVAPYVRAELLSRPEVGLLTSVQSLPQDGIYF
jgi:hypothetical protein